MVHQQHIYFTYLDVLVSMQELCQTELSNKQLKKIKINMIVLLLYVNYKTGCYLETECRLFPPVTIFLDLFLCAGYFFNDFD